MYLSGAVNQLSKLYTFTVVILYTGLTIGYTSGLHQILLSTSLQNSSFCCSYIFPGLVFYFTVSVSGWMKHLFLIFPAPDWLILSWIVQWRGKSSFHGYFLFDFSVPTLIPGSFFFFSTSFLWFFSWCPFFHVQITQGQHILRRFSFLSQILSAST